MQTTNYFGNSSFCVHGSGQNCPQCEDNFVDRQVRVTFSNPDGPVLRRERPISNEALHSWFNEDATLELSNDEDDLRTSD